MSLSEKVQQINREIGSTFERTVADMRQEVSHQISQWLRASGEDLLGRLAELRPPMPESFVAREDLEPAVRSEAEGLAEGLTAGLASQAERGGVSSLREALGAVDRARSQAEILTALMQESARYASRSAILLLRGGEVRGWSGQGFGDADSAVRDLNLGAPGDDSWSHAFDGQGPARLSAGECAALCSRLDTPNPSEGVLVPLVLRDRVAAALYADRTDGAPFTPEALQVLCYTSALAIESLPFRERSSTATLAPVAGLVEGTGQAGATGQTQEDTASEPPAAANSGAQTAAIPAHSGAPARDETEPAQPWSPAARPTTEAIPEAIPEAMTEVNAEAMPASAGWESPAGTTSDVELEVMAEPEPAAQWAAVAEVAEDTGSETYELEPIDDTAAEPATGWSEPDGEDSATPTQKVDLRGLSAVAEAEPEPLPESSPAASGPASSPDATVLLQRSTLLEAREAASPSAPAVVPEPERPLAPPTPIRPLPAPPAPPAQTGDGAPAASATPEVRPPSDVQGPGWAFGAAARQPVATDDPLHEEARRLARLLVSEIKLYNEEQVEEGRRKRDLYERLREDIDRSRQMYEERVEVRILKTTDYFYQELVRILAAGDAKALGI